jgi:hypothetical protein
VDLDKFYMPQGVVDEAENRGKLNKELHRVLENTERFLLVRRTEEMRQAAIRATDDNTHQQ